MPSFYVDDIDIDPSEFVDSCSRNEIKELISALVSNGYIPEVTLQDNDARVSVSEQEYLDALGKLNNKWNRLSNEDTDFIINLAKKF